MADTELHAGDVDHPLRHKDLYAQTIKERSSVTTAVVLAAVAASVSVLFLVGAVVFVLRRQDGNIARIERNIGRIQQLEADRSSLAAQLNHQRRQSEALAEQVRSLGGDPIVMPPLVPPEPVPTTTTSGTTTTTTTAAIGRPTARRPEPPAATTTTRPPTTTTTRPPQPPPTTTTLLPTAPTTPAAVGYFCRVVTDVTAVRCPILPVVTGVEGRKRRV